MTLNFVISSKTNYHPCVTVILKLKQLSTFFLRCQFLASERQFDGESLLNALLYGSDEFNDKINKEILLRIIPNRADDTGVAEGGGMAHHFLV